MIRARNIHKKFQEQQVLDGIDLELDAADTLLLTGISGSGKTTLLRILAGLERPDQGEVLIGDTLASNQSVLIPPARRKIGYVFQEPCLWPHMRVQDQVLYGISRDKTTKNLKLKLLTTAFQLKDFLRKYPAALSLGEQRRVALARSLSTEPQYLFLDEAFVNLDPSLRKEMLSVVSELQKEQRFGMILVSHDPIQEGLDPTRVLALVNGKIEIT